MRKDLQWRRGDVAVCHVIRRTGRGARRRLRVGFVAFSTCFAMLDVGLGCSPSRHDATLDAASKGPPAKESASTRLLAGWAHEGKGAADRLEDSCEDRGAYLRIRRDAGALLSIWRRRLGVAAEVAFGPEVAVDEAGGAITALDRAIERRDCAAVESEARSMAGAFRISEVAVARHEVPAPLFAQALSDAAYRLGQALLESTPYVPEQDDSALADAIGLLDFIESGAQGTPVEVSSELAAFEPLRRAKALSEVKDRAELVRITGVLGATIRRTAASLGFTILPMYPPLHDVEDISALTLPRPALPVDPAQAALGKRLFFDRRLSRAGVRACSSCHIPARAFADGRVTPVSLVPSVPLLRNTPSLLYAPLEARLTWDGRVRTADRQALMVIHAAAEMGLTDRELTRSIVADPSYRAGFRDAFHEDVTVEDVSLALAEYEASAFVPGDAPIDRFANRDHEALSDDARAGFEVFAGKGRCARCHIPPVFGGARPPDFTAPVFATLGVPSVPNARTVDGDVGRDGAFKVPILRNVARTAPYFHHGRYATLEEVVEFYDKGGGAGLGLDVPSQDAEVRPLHLSLEEKRVLLVFMREALTDPS
jgi:cytochrome c peroxidase